MIEELLKSNRISQGDYELYMLYQANELGRKSKERMMNETFMDEPTEKEFGGAGFAFYDGRRSVWRDIHRAILRVEHFLKEANNVGTERPEQ